MVFGYPDRSDNSRNSSLKRDGQTIRFPLINLLRGQLLHVDGKSEAQPLPQGPQLGSGSDRRSSGRIVGDPETTTIYEPQKHIPSLR